MKNVLLLVHDDAGQEARLQSALDITRGLGGHLTCLDVVQVPAQVGDFYSGAGAAMMLDDERDREADNRVRLQARLANEDVPWGWINATGDIAKSLTKASRLADLIIVNRRFHDLSGPDMREIATSVAVHSRKPVVAIPEAATAFAVHGRALIAWDGSPSVAATMQACVPLLKLASAVHIVMVLDGAEQADAEEAAVYLSRHDIHASINRIRDGLTAPDHLIAQEARIWHADYCLMGAYNHGPLAETIFGGVTRRMLKDGKLPLILGH
jgi:nucleotide-binding universal stress UspA family protein